MIEKYQLLYSDMLHDIILKQQLPLLEMDRVTACFWIARHYWIRLKQLLGAPLFDDDKEEVNFFREVKPQFTSHIEYYTLLSEALICQPTDRAAALLFWEEEAKRYTRFCEKHQVFITYYDSDQKDNDHLFFLRRNAGTVGGRFLLEDMEPGWSSLYDHLARKYLAQKMYWETCRTKIGEVVS